MDVPTSPETFHGFSRLPLELKLMIWDQVISAPNTSEIRVTNNFHNETNLCSRRIYVFQEPCALLFVSTESRKHALKNCTFIQLNSRTCMRDDVYTAGGRNIRSGIIQRRSGVFYSKEKAELAGYDSENWSCKKKLWRPMVDSRRLSMDTVFSVDSFDDLRDSCKGLGTRFTQGVRTISFSYAVWREELSFFRNNAWLYEPLRGSQSPLEWIYKLSGLKEIVLTGSIISQRQIPSGKGGKSVQKQVQRDMALLSAKGGDPEWVAPHVRYC